MKEDIEIWKEIKEYPKYKFSNKGRIRSFHKGKDIIMKQYINRDGYLLVCLQQGSKQKVIQVHQLIAVAFHGHVICGHKLVVNHKDFNRVNNCADNLEITTARENTNKKHINSASKYVGVHYHKANKKWVSKTLINGKEVYLGIFEKEIDAHHAYQNKMKELNVITQRL